MRLKKKNITVGFEHLEAETHRFVAKTFAGLEEVLAGELRNLGAQNVEVLRRAVAFEGDKGFMYKANLCLRSALRILQPLAHFKAEDAESLYNQALELPWNMVLGGDVTFAIQFTTHSERFTHGQFAALKLKDAIVDAMRKQVGKRPNVDRESPDVRIDLLISDEDVRISIDTSGESLHKRGYRVEAGRAPLNEALAAGLLILSGWDKRTPLFDPMCGSGTLLIEACLMAMDIPPGTFRDRFGFEKLANYDAELFDTIRNKRLEKVLNPIAPILGADVQGFMLQKVRENLAHAGLDEFIDLKKSDFFQAAAPYFEKGFMVCNPPYGQKLELHDQKFFSNIGDVLKHKYSGWKACLLLPAEIKSIGLKPDRKIPVLNGDIDCRWQIYSLFDGPRNIETV